MPSPSTTVPSPFPPELVAGGSAGIMPPTQDASYGLYDLVVIGAGIGGLTAAALAAHQGFSVVVLEGHNRPGGCAGDFALEGQLFPAGATAISGFEPGGLHDLVYRRLGLTHRAQPLAAAMDVVLPDRRFTLWSARRRWAGEWRRAFPEGQYGIDRLFRWAERTGGAVHRMAARLPVLPPRHAADLVRLSASMRPDVLTTLPYLAQTVERVMERLGADGGLAFRRFIDAQLLDATGCEAATAGAVNGAIALDLYHRGCFTLPGGTAEIARDLVRALRRDGGAIRYRCPAVALRKNADDRWTVRTADGEGFRARTVIANLPAWDLSDLLREPPMSTAGPGLSPDVALQRRSATARQGGRQVWGAVVLHAVVAAEVFPEPHWQHVQVLPDPEEALTEGRMCFATVLPARRNGGPRAVSVSTHSRAERWWGLETEEYEQHKAAVVERLLANLERAYPGFRDGLVAHSAATPRTFAHYTGRGLGFVGGVGNDVWRGVFGALSHRSGIPHLYRCGDTIFPGQGTIGVTLSGINAWRSARDDLFGRWYTPDQGMRRLT